MQPVAIYCKTACIKENYLALKEGENYYKSWFTIKRAFLNSKNVILKLIYEIKQNQINNFKKVEKKLQIILVKINKTTLYLSKFTFANVLLRRAPSIKLNQGFKTAASNKKTRHSIW
ncbi:MULTISPECIES: hypothetical protein [unclassified Sphingobacterium]|uniref:hypothetical protein n=1 Tax=unclassified Sphingobacterium TaxID=2609468 RepID=UPI0025D45AFC|nr:MULTISPECIES: hypothetical protein [unclassified Sphingobacterium]